MKNPKANIMLNDEMLRVFPLRSGRRKVYLLPPLLFSTGNSSQGNYKRQRNKRHPKWKERSKTVFIPRYIFYTENLKESMKKKNN